MVEHPQLALLRERKRQLIARSEALRIEIEEELPPITKLAQWVDLGVRASRLARSLLCGGKSLLWVAGAGVLSALLVKAKSSQGGWGGILNRLYSASSYISWGWQAYQKIKGSWNFLRSSGTPVAK